MIIALLHHDVECNSMSWFLQPYGSASGVGFQRMHLKTANKPAETLPKHSMIFHCIIERR